MSKDCVVRVDNISIQPYLLSTQFLNALNVADFFPQEDDKLTEQFICIKFSSY